MIFQPSTACRYAVVPRVFRVPCSRFSSGTCRARERRCETLKPAADDPGGELAGLCAGVPTIQHRNAIVDAPGSTDLPEVLRSHLLEILPQRTEFRSTKDRLARLELPEDRGELCICFIRAPAVWGSLPNGVDQLRFPDGLVYGDQRQPAVQRRCADQRSIGQPDTRTGTQLPARLPKR